MTWCIIYIKNKIEHLFVLRGNLFGRKECIIRKKRRNIISRRWNIRRYNKKMQKQVEKNKSV